MNLKRTVSILTLTFGLSWLTPAFAQNQLESDPAYLPIDKVFDFKTLKPDVNINLPKYLLKDALADLDGGKNDPFEGTGVKISELIQDIKLIRVVVLNGGKGNGDASEWNGVRQRNQVGAALGALNRCQPRDTKHIALFVIACDDQCERCRLHQDTTTGPGNALCFCFVSDINHVRLTTGVKVCQCL